MINAVSRSIIHTTHSCRKFNVVNNVPWMFEPNKRFFFFFNVFKTNKVEHALEPTLASPPLTLICTRKSLRCSLNAGMSWSKLNRPSMNNLIWALKAARHGVESDCSTVNTACGKLECRTHRQQSVNTACGKLECRTHRQQSVNTACGKLECRTHRQQSVSQMHAIATTFQCSTVLMSNTLSGCVHLWGYGIQGYFTEEFKAIVSAIKKNYRTTAPPSGLVRGLHDHCRMMQYLRKATFALAICMRFDTIFTYFDTSVMP